MTKQYKPNFSDPRVKRAIIKALDWTNTFLSVNNESWLSSREIQKHLTDSSRPLGKYLKYKLLICVNSYYDPLKSICKTYKLDIDGYLELCTAVNYTPKFQVSQRISQELESGNFVYETKSNRDFNPAQFIPKEKRRSVLENHGYRFHYDIEAAAPTLLLQQAQKIHRQKLLNGNENDFTAVALENYINNRSQVRTAIAKECDCSETSVKLVINAILQGAVLSKSSHSTILRELNWNYDLITRLQNNQTLSEIRNDIKSLWGILRDEFPVRYIIDCNGLQRRKSLSGKDKSGYYRSLEELVGKSIRNSLKKNNNKHLWIHDGWSCEKIVDDVELVNEVKTQTGFVIKLDREIFNQ